MPSRKVKSGKVASRPKQPSQSGSGSSKLGAPSITIKHRELVTSFTNSGTGFQGLGQSSHAPGYDLNPGNELLFPWLSHLAPAYERFHFTSLKFHIVSGAAATTTGRIYMMFDYDYNDDVPETMAQLGQNYGHVEGNARDNLTMVIPASMLNADFKERYVSTAKALNGIEPRTVYGGWLFVACNGVGPNSAFDLFVEYTVVLTIPQYPESLLRDTTSQSVAAPLDGLGYSALGVPQGKIPKALPGTGSVPPLTVTNPLGANFLAPWAYDIRALATGTLVSALDIIGLVGAPVAAIDNCGTEVDIFNRYGTHVGYLSTIAAGVVAAAPKNPANLAVNGEPLRVFTSMAIDAIRAAFPTAAFLVPLLYNGVIKGAEVAATSTHSARLEL